MNTVLRHSVLLGTALCIGACDGMDTDATVVQGLRVLNVVSEPASPAPGETPVIDALVADPEGVGFDLWSWWCIDDQCGEGPIPDTLEVNLSDDTIQTATVAALACEPGRCDGPGERSDPDSWLADLGFEGVSFARRTIGISPSETLRLNDNPVLLPVGLDEFVPAGEVTLLSFQIDDALVDEPAAFGFASAGGFLDAQVPLNEEGVFQLELSAPTQSGPITVWVMVDDGLGGSASWTGELEVR